MTLDLAAPVDAADHVRGGGGRQLVVYGDFECPYTAEAMRSLGRLEASGAIFELLFRHFPLRDIHPHAEAAAGISEAAARQGRFWEMHDLLFSNQRHLEDADLRQEAERLGLDMTRVHQTSLTQPSRLGWNETWRAVPAAGSMAHPARSSMACGIADRAIRSAWQKR